MMWAWKFCLCRRHSDYEEEEGTMIENFMGPQNLAEEWLLCETNLKSFWYFMIMTYKCVSHHRAHNKWWKTQPTFSTLRSHFEKGNRTTSLSPLMQAFIKKVFSRMSLPFKSMFLLFDNIFLSIIVSVHIWSLSTHVFTIQINFDSFLICFSDRDSLTSHYHDLNSWVNLLETSLSI